MITRRLLLALTALLALPVGRGLAQDRAQDQGQALPSRTIRMVVAFPPGGPTDFVARLLADKLKALLAQNVIVENRAGANGAVGAEYVARAEPDGTTLFLTTVGAVAVTPHLMAKVAYDPIRDFAPITLVVRNTTVLVVKPEMPVVSARELAALAARGPGSIAIASTGSGSMPHLALELYQAAAGVKFLHVPYRGAAQALTDVLGAQVQGMFADTLFLLPQIKAGKIRPLGAASASRNAALPDVPTLAEQGFADTSADNWYGLLAPARTPAAVIGKLNDAVTTALAAPDMREKLIGSGAIPAATSATEFAALLRDELDRWGRVMREKNIKAEE
ncbi:MAG TPA: tripartite tricarboxylate transporter substrate-binding protein [Xanthobacteraceae bacterium]